jgi:glycosyltransferase involved in cell wall biosynthesis
LGTNPLVYRLREAESRVINAHNVHILTRALEEFIPDVVYVHNIVGLGGLGLMACLQLLDVPWVWQLGDCIPLELTSTSDGVVPGLAAVYSGAIRGVYSVVSQRVIDEINAAGVALHGRVELLPYWITGERPTPRTRFYSGGRLKILAAGRVNLQKGFEILIEAVGLVHAAALDDVVLDIFGEVCDPYFHSLIRNLGLKNQVRLMGSCPQSELLRLYGEYDVVAFPTQPREPFGLVPLEAASRGCVPVITRTCGIAEWLVHGVHCLKAERSADAFAKVLRSVATGEVALEPLARRAFEAAWRDFHLDTILPRIERALAVAATQRRVAAHRPADLDRIARIAERLTDALVQEACA